MWGLPWSHGLTPPYLPPLRAPTPLIALFSGPDRARLTSKGPLHPPFCISPRPLLFNPAPNKSPPAASRHMFSILWLHLPPSSPPYAAHRLLLNSSLSPHPPEKNWDKKNTQCFSPQYLSNYTQVLPYCSFRLSLLTLSPLFWCSPDIPKFQPPKLNTHLPLHTPSYRPSLIFCLDLSTYILSMTHTNILFSYHFANSVKLIMKINNDQKDIK